MARILVAEDEASLREFVQRALVHHGHDVTAVRDGAEALHLLQGEEEFDLLLTDIVMPVMDGIALSLKVAKELPELRILLMTGYAAERQRAYNLDDLIYDVVAKPFTLTEICDKVEDALRSVKSSTAPATTKDQGLS
ncbi:response regulator [Sneathiella glossodoripedis]|uniref:response regulator n=1 Tax=Sneathiella glossodoripedis TaxID=418853 RepID=UPI0004719505|nr:response regulator [Sneathiella glossodoripedis]